MKRLISLFCIVMMLISMLASCDNKPNEVNYIFSESNFYLEDNGRIIDISYPIISGVSNDTLINEQLKNASIDYMEQYLLYSGTDGYYRYTVDSVTSTYIGEHLASFLCIGIYQNEGSSHPDSIVYTLNLDPKTGKIYKFNDLISDFELLADKFRSGKFKLVNGIDDLLEYTNYNDMFVEYSSLYEIYPPVYFISDGKNTELAFSVGLVYTLGGHAEFSIDISSIKAALTDTLKDLLQ